MFNRTVFYPALVVETAASFDAFRQQFATRDDFRGARNLFSKEGAVTFTNPGLKGEGSGLMVRLPDGQVALCCFSFSDLCDTREEALALAASMTGEGGDMEGQQVLVMSASATQFGRA